MRSLLESRTTAVATNTRSLFYFTMAKDSDSDEGSRPEGSVEDSEEISNVMMTSDEVNYLVYRYAPTASTLSPRVGKGFSTSPALISISDFSPLSPLKILQVPSGVGVCAQRLLLRTRKHARKDGPASQR